MTQVCYICSAARSGSTLTDMFLGGHPDVASLGELNFLSKAVSVEELCSCGAKVCECDAWRRVIDRISRERGIDFLDTPYAFRLWDMKAYNNIDHKHQTRMMLAQIRMNSLWMYLREAFPSPFRDHVPLPPTLSEAINNKIYLYKVISEEWNKRIIIDSSKSVREAIELYKKMNGGFRIIILVRDGRGVFLSRRKSGRTQRESLDGWLKYYQRALPLLSKHVREEDVFMLRYEDLASSPGDVGERLADFLGLDSSDALRSMSPGVRHLVNGNDTRFSVGKGITLDERWRRELAGDDMEYFMKFGDDMNHRFGYF